MPFFKEIGGRQTTAEILKKLYWIIIFVLGEIPLRDPTDMKKKKETLWQLLTRLDHEAGQFSSHLHEANRYFDGAAKVTGKLLKKHETDLNKLITKIRKPLKSLLRKKKKNK
jgi:hypothetical protein